MPTRLSCKIDYLLRSNHRDQSIASSFFTDDYLGGYTDRVLDQNTVTVEVPYDEHDKIIEEAESRNGRLDRE
jgi:hypothetical protein